MAAYKTPGVYIEEIVKFPPSVAQVETAIPAFIGYTEKAEKKNGDSLVLVPTRISSLLEYETLFGSALKEDSITVAINDKMIDGNVERTYTVSKPTSPKPFLMYYSLQMYFANGGGPCYIVSVKEYGAQASSPATLVSKTDLDKGLAKLRKEDEPTLILFPDATKLGNTDDFYALYNDALTQCNELQDRFTIIDTENDDEENDEPVDDLRGKISNDKDYVKYGAAYYPFLETILDYHYDESKVNITHAQEAETTLEDELAAAKNATTAVEALVTSTGTLVSELGTINTDIQNNNAANATSKRDTAIAKVQEIINAIGTVVTAATPAVTAGNDAGSTTEATALNTAITDSSKDLLKLKTDLETKNAALAGKTGGAVKTDLASIVTDADTTVAKIQAVDALIDAIVTTISSANSASNPSLNGKKLNEVEAIDNAAYNKIKAEINAMPMVLPPSSTMAGVYARVDSDRGVWKAPANVSLNYVIKPTLQISHEEQKSLNVDTVAGKSINAIRSFTGKGVLVWGGRTLAGNDNEWRYISVRRFFNMAEESIKKATEQFVFEPNDKNTWVRVKAMINNFLTSQWRAGALAGPTPEKAFYVNIGLGETMTAQDILEGNMIVEIGMAVVRPAEFIILRFSHKMQEA
ncbi:phage tail sheath family protein [Pseudotenacibaculum haliotis]|uniref:Phage tail sheath C-terminal domain-containing protein n=1 Tax=Pseudotenacibaculum haliotis TaxID=1862138 RepID=A0ABW5LTV2_9FLAO